MLKTAPECWPSVSRTSTGRLSVIRAAPSDSLTRISTTGVCPSLDRGALHSLLQLGGADRNSTSVIGSYRDHSIARFSVEHGLRRQSAKDTAVNSSVRDSKNANPLLHIIPYLLFHTGSAGGTSARPLPRPELPSFSTII